MNKLSDYLVNTIIAEKRREAMRLAKTKRRAKSNEDQPAKHFWQSFKAFAMHMQYGPHMPDEVVHSEESLNHAEMLGLSPQGLLRQEANRRLYERIAQGNALVEAEYLSQKLREGRL
jgi:hypothetical protein